MAIHEKIIKQPDGKRFKIVVDLINQRKIIPFVWRFDVYHRFKGGREWHNLPDSLIYSDLFSMPQQQKDQHRINNSLRFVPAEAVQAALMEAWEKLKPNKFKIEFSDKFSDEKPIYKPDLHKY